MIPGYARGSLFLFPVAFGSGRAHDGCMERDKAIELALGRIFRMGSRPTQRCRAIILDARDPIPGYTPNYARDRNRGAQGD